MPFRMRKDLAALLELERKTKAKKIAPLVHAGSAFLIWQPRAYRVWRRRQTIVLAQLQLRADMGLAPDEKAAPVASVCQQHYEEDSMLPGRAKLFGFLRSDDALPTVLEFVEGDSINDFGFVQFLYRCETRFGKLTDEETAGIAKMKTVGEFAELLAKAAAEGREKGEPFSESRGMRLFGRVVLAISICCLVYFAYSVIAWLVRKM
jgi:hypothetical protein